MEGQQYWGNSRWPWVNSTVEDEGGKWLRAQWGLMLTGQMREGQLIINKIREIESSHRISMSEEDDRPIPFLVETEYSLARNNKKNVVCSEVQLYQPPEQPGLILSSSVLNSSPTYDLWPQQGISFHGMKQFLLLGIFSVDSKRDSSCFYRSQSSHIWDANSNVSFQFAPIHDCCRHLPFVDSISVNKQLNNTPCIVTISCVGISGTKHGKIWPVSPFILVSKE